MVEHKRLHGERCSARGARSCLVRGPWVVARRRKGTHLKVKSRRVSEKRNSALPALEKSKNLFRVEIERSTFVTRAQFETEFIAYKQVFKELAQVRLAIESVAPSLSVQRLGESDQDKRRHLLDRLSELKEAYSLVLQHALEAPFGGWRLCRFFDVGASVKI